ncbi:MAG TPA: choice-of-anchor Q domain-containing protein [Candidatus Limnocylindrales bacterium]|nr:choice-of-anchor Q domain-containing protein [Candidatus Limnocylindrales bacterium]
MNIRNIRNYSACVLAFCLLAMTPDWSEAAVLTVMNSNDTGAGSLRDTIASASSGDTIDFDAGLAGSVIRFGSAITVDKDLTIDGTGVPVTLSGDSNGNGSADVQLFVVAFEINFTLDHVTLTKGLGDVGGCILSTGRLFFYDSTVSACHASAAGGGIYATYATISGSTINGNSGDQGGGIYVASSALIVNSTIYGNTAATDGGGIQGRVTAGVQLYNTTVMANSAPLTAGGGIATRGPLDLVNTIIAGSTGADCKLESGGSIGTNTSNLIEDASCPAAFSGDPMLSPLGNYGGPTQTAPPMNGSLANDHGDETYCLASPTGGVDQRGITRPVGSGCDIGATEEQNILYVTAGGDDDDGTCDAHCTLREAMNAAAAAFGPNLIRFADTTFITLESSLPQIHKTLTIDGAGQYVVITGVDETNVPVQVFSIDGGTVEMNGLQIQGGGAVAGGAIMVDSATLAIEGCSFNNNVAIDGGVIHASSSTLAIEGSSFSNNVAGTGGAIYVSSSTLSVLDSYFAGNGADSDGGAVYSTNSATSIRNSTFSASFSNSITGGAITLDTGSLELTNSTLSYNSVGLVRLASGGNLSIVNNIIANSLHADCLSTAFAVNHHNLIEDGSCNPALSGDPNLAGDPDDNGGPTYTLKLNVPSSAIDAGDDTTCHLLGDRDQRGFPRPVGAHCDLGAYEAGIPVCGNGLVEYGEICDDGNVANGDCCSSTCTFEADGAPCWEDGVGCTVDECDSVGRCLHTADDSACDDGTLCTRDYCNVESGCESDDTPQTCDNDAPGGATLSLANSDDAGKRAVSFKWGKAGFAKEDLGSPTTDTAYELCVYDANGLVIFLQPLAGNATCEDESCWSETTKGFKYKDRRKPAPGDGISGIAGTSSTTGSGKVQLKAKGSTIPTFALGDGLEGTVVAQVRTSDASCWQASFGADEIKSNGAAKFAASYKAP